MIRTDTGYIRNINSVFVGIITIIVLVALWQIRSVLMLAVAGMMLTVFAAMPVRFFMEKGLNRGLAILLSVSSGIIILIIFSLLVFPTLFDQFSVLFTSTIPNGITRLADAWNSGEIYERIPLLRDILASVDLTSFTIDAEFVNQVVNQISSALTSVGGSVLPLLGGVASAALSTLIIFFLCIYLIAEPERYINGIIILTPLWYRDRMRAILARIDLTIRAWLKVTGVSMLIVGVGTGIGLAFLGIEQSLALGVLAGILSFIPNFGTIAALVPAVAVGIVQAPNSVWIMVVILFAVSFFQSQIVGPVMTADSMNLPPVLVLVGQIIFGFFFGFLGVMLAVPLTAISVVLVEEIYVKDILGDPRDQKNKNRVQEEPMVLSEAD